MTHTPSWVFTREAVVAVGVPGVTRSRSPCRARRRRRGARGCPRSRRPSRPARTRPTAWVEELERVDLLALEQELGVREQRRARLVSPVDRAGRAHDQAQVLHVEMVEAHVVDVGRREAALGDRLLDRVVEAWRTPCRRGTRRSASAAGRRTGPRRRPRRSSAPRPAFQRPLEVLELHDHEPVDDVHERVDPLRGAVEREGQRIAGGSEVHGLDPAHAVLGIANRPRNCAPPPGSRRAGRPGATRRRPRRTRESASIPRVSGDSTVAIDPPPRRREDGS